VKRLCDTRFSDFDEIGGFKIEDRMLASGAHWHVDAFTLAMNNKQAHFALARCSAASASAAAS
jgi:hypothetical protein